MGNTDRPDDTAQMGRPGSIPAERFPFVGFACVAATGDRPRPPASRSYGRWARPVPSAVGGGRGPGLDPPGAADVRSPVAAGHGGRSLATTLATGPEPSSERREGVWEGVVLQLAPRWPTCWAWALVLSPVVASSAVGRRCAGGFVGCGPGGAIRIWWGDGCKATANKVLRALSHCCLLC